MTDRSPPPAVLAAFGAQAKPVPLAGGRGSSWRAGGIVLKPLDLSEAELEWQEQTLSSIECDGFRVSRPIRMADGALVANGWSAWEWLDGAHAPRRWADVIAAGTAFHAALARVPRPDFIARRDDPWAIGDRVAWGEMNPDQLPTVAHLPRLLGALQPVGMPSQVVHGDLTGNVLFDESLPPAIIDLSPYWRPVGFASAVVVADALVWEGADERILEAVEHVEQFAQLLLRALVYRVVTDRLFRAGEPLRAPDADPYLPAVELAVTLARDGAP